MGTAKVLIFAVAIVLVLGIIYIDLALVNISDFHEGTINAQQFDLKDAFNVQIELAFIWAFRISVIIYFYWIVLVVKWTNTHMKTTFSPHFYWMGLFIPVFNIYWMYKSISNISKTYKNVIPSGIIAIWVFLLFVSTLISVSLSQRTFKTVPDIVEGHYIVIIGMMLSVLAALPFVFIIWKISRSLNNEAKINFGTEFLE